MAEGVKRKCLSKFFKSFLGFLFDTVLNKDEELKDIISVLPFHFNEFILNHAWKRKIGIEMRTSCLVLL